VRRIMMFLGAGLLAVLWLTSVQADQTKNTKKLPPGLEKPACDGDFGTSVHFEPTPSDAAKKAIKEEKLVFVLHVSGLFENPDFT
jgi:hypothetical protein